MAEYIEREALFHRTKAVAANVIFRGCEEMVSPKDSCNPREWTKGYEHGMKESLNLIATQGAADVVPVCRCKDCIHYDMRSKESGYCYFWDHEQGMEPNRVVYDDFCSYGERKDGDG